MLEILVALVLATGFFILGTLFYSKTVSSEKRVGLLILSLVLIGLGILIVIMQYGIAILVRKIAAIGLIILGLFITFKVPRAEEDQPGYIVPVIILTGLFLLFLGIYWILF